MYISGIVIELFIISTPKADGIMRSSRQTIIINKRIASIVIGALFLLCACFSFIFALPTRMAKADGESSDETNNGIRFIQVAAGEDFAIGLTYDYKLYGWSLIDNATSKGNSSTSLGEYYTSTPTEIDVVFRRGPFIAKESTATGDYTFTDPQYHTPLSELDNVSDKIKTIVATRTTAAFVTQKGYIYTWGYDNTENVYTEEQAALSNIKHYLLLRPNEYKGLNILNTPYIIDYNYYAAQSATDPALNKLIPKPEVYHEFNIKIAASEYNYTVLFGDSKSTYHYTWGSLMYGLPNIAAPINETNLANYNSLSSTSGTDLNDNTSYQAYMKGGLVRYVTEISRSSYVGDVVAGGYNVGINNSGLYLRGRNFLTSQGVSVSDKTITVANILEVTNGANAAYKHAAGTASETNPEYSVQEAIMGGTIGTPNTNGSGIVADQGATGSSLTLNQYYGYNNTSFINNSVVDIYGAHDLTNGLVGNDTSTGFGAVRYGVSLGNDVGYGIVSGGSSDNTLYAWGDNAHNQLATTATTAYSTTPRAVTGITGSVVSVAAGKQLSGAVKAFNSYNTLTAANTAWNQKTSDEDESGLDILNKEEFITGAITSDGALYVWSNLSATPTPIKFGNAATVKDSDKFVAVYSGYGNHLFAITAVGKVVHITAKTAETGGVQYDQDIYDTFANKNGAIKNWSLNAGDDLVANRIVFSPTADPTLANYAPSFDPATFYVWNTDAVSNSNITVNGANGTYNVLVKDNNIGDVYRILTENNKTFLKENENVTGDVAITDFAPKYYYNGVKEENLLDRVQQENMFKAEIVTDANGEGIKITPLQSSHGKTITVVFYVARYNHSANFTSATVDTALYYDYMECRMEFTIADTPTVVHYRPFDGADGSGNSKIPLLDPNNGYNNYYSLALQDVSSGVDELIKYLSVGTTTVDTFKANVIKAMSDKDLGFPALSKVEAGNLDYYLGESKTNASVNKYYTDIYQYLFDDRDADRVVLSTADISLNPINISDRGQIDKKILPIDVTVNVPQNVTLNTDNVAKLAKRFKNRFGLYDISVNTEGANDTLSFKYDVLQLYATAATGEVSYSGNSVSSFVTTRGRDGMMLTFENIATQPTDFTNNYNRYDISYTMHAQDGVSIGNGGRTVANAVSVSAQPSLRLKVNIPGSDNTSGGIIFGAGSGSDVNNKIRIDYPKTLYVGSTETINLSDFIGLDGDAANSRALADTIRFSYKNSVNSFSEFNKQFMDESGGSSIPVIELSGTQLKVSPTTNMPINLTVSVQRFTSNDYQKVFGEDEKIYFTFVFGNIQDFNLNAIDSVKTFIINSPSVINVFGKDVDETAINGPYISISGVDTQSIAALSNMVRISDIKTSEDNKEISNKLFTCSEPEGGKFVITPRASGSGFAQFIVHVYGKTVFVKLTLNISSTTTLPDSETVIVVDDQYLYVSDIQNKLEQANSFNGANDMSAYKILYSDVQNPEAPLIDRVYNAVEFKTADGTPASPPFIKNVVFEGIDTNPSIRIVSANTAVQDIETYYMHVTFVRGNANTYAEALESDKLVVRIPVKSGKIVINSYMVSLDCKNPADNDYISYNGTSGVNTQATISVSYLLNSINIEGAPRYDVFLVSSATTTSNYFNYAPSANKKDVVITPLYNTPEPCEVNVSVSNGSLSYVVTFAVSVDGILTVLPKTTTDGTIGYAEIWLYAFIIVFGVLAIIFIIRIIVYWRKRAKQRAIIKRNQELIRMRDRMHNKANAASKEQIVRTKMKMEDPKYVKMFNDMRKDKENESGITLENSDLAAAADAKAKKNKKKKKGGKKTVAELKAELEAKKAAFAAAQANAQPVDPFAAGMPMDGSDFVAPDDGFVAQDGFGDPNGDFVTPDIDGGEIIFDATDLGDGM